ncbi:DUF1684 domain-containing protein [Aureimonas leprariae]|uniref:DUF1684 domain-containing protein n=1 Tax=Plantimonas leprariae TaxID=2615207 RepID=A0A7V7PRL8_9HYPH|nr:DUF1684 domain-containing protein [Aureimonas leprariae]KAB0681372.1 DUF1684 domain-containing protein [Aureimonas leprariae]
MSESWDEGALALWDWRRRVTRLYAAAEAEPDPRRAWSDWRAGRDDLFANHSQSPLEPDARRGFVGLPFFAYDPALRFRVGVSPVESVVTPLEVGADGTVSLRSFARTAGLAASLGGELTLFWVEGYGGGVFLPFADATNGSTTYGAGRYLLDTIKGADLGRDASGSIVLDFNFAYNPSCCYSSAYVCPLAPASNRLPKPVPAGEMMPPA